MLVNFFKHVTNLKSIPRQGWINKLELQRPESVADHSYSMTMMAMIFADRLKLDTEKILRMSLLHDLAESVTGDITPESMPKENKISAENNAMNKILEELEDKKTSETYLAIWKEYLDEKSRESILLHQIDKLEMVFQAKIYENFSSKDKIQDFISSAKSKITDESLLNFLEQIINHKYFETKDVRTK